MCLPHITVKFKYFNKKDLIHNQNINNVEKIFTGRENSNSLVSIMENPFLIITTKKLYIITKYLTPFS